MRITIFNGSPKGERSNTLKVAAEFAEGARSAGAEVEVVHLAGLKIGHCLGCFHCWEKEPGVCVLKDDMGGQLRKVAASDLAVFATPLYIDNVSGMTKVFMDRLTPLVDPTIFRDEAGECFHRTRLPKNPRLGVISSCGFPEQRHFDVLKLLFRRVARNLDSELAFEIYRDAGPVMAVAPFLLKDAFGRYRDLLREAGARVVRDGAISQETAAALAEPLLPPDRYVESSNARFQRLLSKLKDTGAA